jgi:hypothetical protein
MVGHFMRFLYGDSWEKFPICPGEPWLIGNQNISITNLVMVHDIFEPVPQFLKTADMIFVDPPWTQGNLVSFYTKAEIKGVYRKFDAFLDRVFVYITEIHPKVCYIEIGKQFVDIMEARLKQLFPYCARFAVTYYRRHPCFLLRASQDPTPFADLTGLDEADCIKFVCQHESYHCVADFCMGRGLVGLAAFANQKHFVGTELNPRRLAVLLDKLAQFGAVVYPMKY